VADPGLIRPSSAPPSGRGTGTAADGDTAPDAGAQPMMPGWPCGAYTPSERPTPSTSTTITSPGSAPTTTSGPHSTASAPGSRPSHSIRTEPPVITSATAGMSGCHRLCPGTERVAEPAAAGGPGKRTAGGAAASVGAKAGSFRDGRLEKIR
jgi:hypothetical protein